MQRLQLLSSLLVVIGCVASVTGRTYDRCSLAKELDGMSVPRAELAIWTCIAQHESNFNTDAISPPDPNGSINYGLFQINSRWWCQGPSGESANLCNVNCSELTGDDISKTVTCARKIRTDQGWTAWTVYRPRCSGDLPSIDDCF